MPLNLTEADITERAKLLPAFPSVVTDILSTLDDDNATLSTLIQLVERDPVITARVLSVANAAAMSGMRKGLRDMHVAVSLIGLSQVREIVMGVSLAEFARESLSGSFFWQHSVAVGVAAQELARFCHYPGHYALVAGILHDIGQLWMARFYPLECQMVRMAQETEPQDIREIERRYFGIDHCTIGKILATSWKLPAAVVAAIEHHHSLSPHPEKLVAVTHLAEVLAVALDLVPSVQAHISGVSAEACNQLGIDWQEDLRHLFGRIDARTRHVGKIFSQ